MPKIRTSRSPNEFTDSTTALTWSWYNGNLDTAPGNVTHPQMSSGTRFADPMGRVSGNKKINALWAEKLEDIYHPSWREALISLLNKGLIKPSTELHIFSSGEIIVTREYLIEARRQEAEESPIQHGFSIYANPRKSSQENA